MRLSVRSAQTPRRPHAPLGNGVNVLLQQEFAAAGQLHFDERAAAEVGAIRLMYRACCGILPTIRASPKFRTVARRLARGHLRCCCRRRLDHSSSCCNRIVVVRSAITGADAATVLRRCLVKASEAKHCSHKQTATAGWTLRSPSPMELRTGRRRRNSTRERG
jgi:hypothetical protein